MQVVRVTPILTRSSVNYTYGRSNSLLFPYCISSNFIGVSNDELSDLWSNQAMDSAVFNGFIPEVSDTY
jgi:hypothetical protein